MLNSLWNAHRIVEQDDHRRAGVLGVVVVLASLHCPAVTGSSTFPYSLVSPREQHGWGEWWQCHRAMQSVLVCRSPEAGQSALLRQIRALTSHESMESVDVSGMAESVGVDVEVDLF